MKVVARSVTWVGITAALFALGVPAPLTAQGSGVVTGFAFDASTAQPLEGVRVEILQRSIAASSDREGRFAFSDLPAGSITLRVTHPGYGSLVETYEVTDMEETLIWFPMMPTHVALEEILVEARRRGSGSSSFEEQVRGSRGDATTAADLLAQRVPGLRVDRTSGAIGGGASVTIRGLSSIGGSNAPAIYLDGIRIDDRATGLRGSREPQAIHVLESVPASDVRQIRVLRGPAASAYFGDSSNGVIVIETVHGGTGPR